MQKALKDLENKQNDIKTASEEVAKYAKVLKKRS